MKIVNEWSLRPHLTSKFTITAHLGHDRLIHALSPLLGLLWGLLVSDVLIFLNRYFQVA
jgi:hypothetical protein